MASPIVIVDSVPRRYGLSDYNELLDETIEFTANHVVWPRVTHNLSLSTTKYPVESGKSFIEHSVRKPAKLTMQGIIANKYVRPEEEINPAIERAVRAAGGDILNSNDVLANPNVATIVQRQGRHDDELAAEVLRKLMDKMDRRVRIDTYTPYGVYQNMIITDITVDDGGEIAQAGNIPFTISLEEHQAVDLDAYIQIGNGVEKTIPLPISSLPMQPVERGTINAFSTLYDVHQEYQRTPQQVVMEHVPFIPSGWTEQPVRVYPGELVYGRNELEQPVGSPTLFPIDITIKWIGGDTKFWVIDVAGHIGTEVSTEAPRYVRKGIRIVPNTPLLEWNGGHFVVLPKGNTPLNDDVGINAWDTTHYFAWVPVEYSGLDVSLTAEDLLSGIVSTPNERFQPINVIISNPRDERYRRIINGEEIHYRGRGAFARVTEVGGDGKLKEIGVFSQGSGYTNTTTVEIVGGGVADGGDQVAKAVPILGNGRVFGVHINSGGKGYGEDLELRVRTISPDGPSWWSWQAAVNRGKKFAKAFLGLFGRGGGGVQSASGAAAIAGVSDFYDPFQNDNTPGRGAKLSYTLGVNGTIDRVFVDDPGEEYLYGRAEIEFGGSKPTEEADLELLLYEMVLVSIQIDEEGSGYRKLG